MTSFESEPPTITIRGAETKLRPWNRGARHVMAQLENLDDVKQYSAALLLGFAVVYSLPPDEARKLVFDEAAFNEAVAVADMELSNEDLQKLDAYIGGILERAEAAQVSVEPPGKDKTGETLPAS